MTLATEKHPYKQFIPENIKYLIVGSFPPIKLTKKLDYNIKSLGVESAYARYNSNKRNHANNSDIDFYYGSSDNLFWGLLEDVFSIKLSNAEDVKAFLSEKNIGITDVCEEVSRKVDVKKNSINSSDNDLVVHLSRDITHIIKANPNISILSTSKWVTERIQLQLNQLLYVPIITLPSPSKAASRAIGRSEEYKAMKEKGILENTLDYRVMKYREVFGNLK